MSFVTHALMVISYIILAAGALVLGPSWFGISDQTASILAVVVFFAAWHVQLMIMMRFERNQVQEDIADLRHAIAHLKGVALSSDETAPSGVVAELKILQGLLAQLEKRPKLEDASNNVIDLEAEKFVADVDDTHATAKDSRGLSSLEIMNITQAALIENRVDLYMQPIVYLPSRNLVHYECFTRVRSKDGLVIDAGRYISFVKDKGLAGTLDNLLFFRLIQIIRKLGPRQPTMKFFCNMSKESLNDNDFFPQFSDYISNNRDFACRIVLEITRDDYEQLSPKVIERLLSLGRHGCVISLDQMTDLNMDFFELEKQYVRYLKIDLDMLLEKHDMSEIPSLVSILRSRQIYLILSKIETEHDSLQAADCQVELAQGYLYGELKDAHEYTENF